MPTFFKKGSYQPRIGFLMTMTEQLNTATFLNLSETPAAKQCYHRIGFLNVSTLPPSVGEGFI